VLTKACKICLKVCFPEELMKRHYALRGAIGFGLTALLLFVLFIGYTITKGQPRIEYFYAVGPICGIIGGLAYGRRWGLPLLLGTCFAIFGVMLTMQDAGHSTLLTDVVMSGLASGFLFWTIGKCAMLTFPQHSRFDGAMAFAVPGGVAGVAFQFLYGPGYSLFNLGSRSWWANWEHLIVWLIAGTGAGWLFGAELDRLQQGPTLMEGVRERNPWVTASIAFSGLGLGMGALFLLRDALPLGLINSISPVSVASDWFWSWGVLAAIVGVIALFEALRKTQRMHSRNWAVAGIALAVVLLFGSYGIMADPWKTQFNTDYAAKLLREHGQSGDPENGYAVYTGNLILSQSALDNNDNAAAAKYLLLAATSSGVGNVADSGPDITVARVLLQRGDKETVIEYLRRCHNLWPKGAPLLDRWQTQIRNGRTPNFNNRTIPTPDAAAPPRS
jgi:hypothetical protein